MNIKRSALDSLFSNVIREAYNWTCQRCFKQSSKGGSNGFIDCAHNFSRRYKFTRFSVYNCVALCRGCHTYLTQNPDMHDQFFRQFFGEHYFTSREKARDSRYKLYKKDMDEIKAHYMKAEKELKELRLKGVQGTIRIDEPEILT